MSLRLPDKWVWDFWLAQDGPDIHIFYLQAPRSLGDETKRHWHVSIGHAVSQDLVNWEILPDALAPTADEESAWDSYTTWTGSVIHHEGTWFMFYTGGSKAEKGLVQRIGLATSADLLHWRKHPRNPLIEADPRWYEHLDLDLWHDQAWRDPWIFRHDGRFHAFITARANEGPTMERGVIGHAHSADLINWEVGPPVATPAEFGYLEVPQLVPLDGRWYVLYCVTTAQYAAKRLARPGVSPVTGTHYLVGDHPLGPFELITDEFLAGDQAGSLYAGKLFTWPDGRTVMLNTRAWTGDGGFTGEIADPQPVEVRPDGRLRINSA